MLRETAMQPFEVLFDHAEGSPFEDAAFAPYGNFGFPAAPEGRPWIYSNFVQSLDGITSLLGEYASGQYISQSREDRWLMDLLRANADGVVMGMATLVEEKRLRGPARRGIVFQVVDPAMQNLRTRLGKGRERNDRLVAVPVTCRVFSDCQSLKDLNENRIREIEEFFVSYNRIHGKKFKVRECVGPKAAEKILADGIKAYHKKH